MLVKKSIVENWYQTDSWVYKNFAYLFQNPLWHKKIPNGFSVCPYFWLNLFSFFIFRPFFVAPIKYVLLPIIKAIGKPAYMVDKGLYNLQRKFGLGSDDYFPSCGIVMTVLYALVTAAVGFLLLGLGIKVHDLYKYLDGVQAGLYCFWSIASFIGLFITIIMHKAITQSECKTMYYLFVWFALFIISAFVFVSQDFIQVMTIFFTGIAAGIKLLAVGFAYGLRGIWIGIKYIALWNPLEILLIPWWGYMLVLSAIGWICNKIGEYLDKKEMNRLLRVNPDELHSRFCNAWLDLFVKVLLMNKEWKKNEIFNQCFELYTGKVCGINRYTILRQTFEVMWKDELTKLQNIYPLLKQGGWKALNELDDDGSSNFRFFTLGYNLTNVADFPKLDIDKFVATMRDIVSNDPDIKAMADEYRAADKAKWAKKEAKKEAKKQSWSHLMCLKITVAIAESVWSIGRTIKWAFCQLGIFIVYMWMLIKAKKQGVCPYFVFTTPK